MDNDLRGEKAAFLATHFSSRFAFWANIAWGSLVLILFSFFLKQRINADFPLLILTIFSFWMAHEHLKSLYDTILKSYYMKKKNFSI
jgi:hypothetical protein